MRRWSIGVGLVALMMLLGSPAGAQTSGLRDPFNPLLTAGDSTSPTTPTAPDDPVIVPDPDPAPPATDDLPTTGGDPLDWMAIAYMLIAIGTGLVAYVRVTHPRARRVSF